MSHDPELAARIASELVARMARSRLAIPVGVSGRHLHLSAGDFTALFGREEAMASLRPLGQPGQFACRQTVDIEGPRGRLSRVRILGPARARSQVEMSRTDAIALGISPPIRQSGDLAGACAVRFIGPKGMVEARGAVIAAQRHLHVPPAEASRLALRDNEVVRVRAGRGGPRELVFEAVVARVSERFALEFHVDTDEANAASLRTGDTVHLA